MNQSENKVNWCLKKAEKELNEGSKHRGLVKSSEDLKRAREHIAKAEHNLNAISYFNKGGFSDWSMSAVFYCIYHCFLAVAANFGYESRNQECTIALIRFLKEQNKINLDDKFISILENYDETERHETSVIESREFYTYGIRISVDDKKEIEQKIILCKDCLDQTKQIIFGGRNE
ncbi:MAG TPA: HEPN domain-containing protein [Candidatus Paceibacterota bacterium]|nr:HEPN domain-containing protein [Candidatus Paceibacterota bacterium]